MRKSDYERIGVKRGAGVHRGCRILPEMLADAAETGEEFLFDGGYSGSDSRGRRERGLWHLYGGVY
jgi:hypothetical protein